MCVSYGRGGARRDARMKTRDERGERKDRRRPLRALLVAKTQVGRAPMTQIETAIPGLPYRGRRKSRQQKIPSSAFLWLGTNLLSRKAPPYFVPPLFGQLSLSKYLSPKQTHYVWKIEYFRAINSLHIKWDSIDAESREIHH
jgi:hypothetical protein